ncbi:hypothetical protein FRC00_003014 [Tulasnella sp. 408]|nr:hypothetical protein FRC00_003014 [Tulasnella sp. 408]
MSTPNNRRPGPPALNAPYINPPPIWMGFGPSPPGASPPVLPPIRFQRGGFADSTGRSNAAATPSIARHNSPTQQNNAAMSPHQRLIASATLPARPQGAVITKSSGLPATVASQNNKAPLLSPSSLGSRNEAITSSSNRPDFLPQPPFLPTAPTAPPQQTPAAPHARLPPGGLAAIPGTPSVEREGLRPKADSPPPHRPYDPLKPPVNPRFVPEGASDRNRLVLGDLMRKKKKVSERGGL